VGWSRRGAWLEVARMSASSPEEIHALIAAAFNAGDNPMSPE
jgi:hypothetical protein